MNHENRQLWAERPLDEIPVKAAGILRLGVLSDTHLGMGWNARTARSRLKRRGEDHWRCYRAALAGIRAAKVDGILHLGDLCYRSRIPQGVFSQALEPLLDCCREGLPVALLPGNHERSRIPQSLFDEDPLLHIFHRPGVLEWDLQQISLKIMGIPFVREAAVQVPLLQKDCRARREPGTLHLLLLHQLLSQSRVGPAGYRFRPGGEVIDWQALSPGWDLVLSGHLHRAQLLSAEGRPPVLFPGSTERTSFAEVDEQKGFCLLDWSIEALRSGRITQPELHWLPLPARHQVRALLPETCCRHPAEMEKWLSENIHDVQEDSWIYLEHPLALDPDSAARLGKLEEAGALLELRLKAREDIVP